MGKDSRQWLAGGATTEPAVACTSLNASQALSGTIPAVATHAAGAVAIAESGADSADERSRVYSLMYW